MKKTICLFILLLSYYANSQSFTLFDVNTTSFPTIKAKFYAFDANGMQILNLSPTDFEVKENGQLRNVTYISCPAPTPPTSISSVLTIDISGSMGNGGLDIAKAAANAWINLLPISTNECAVTSFNNYNYLNQDFTKDKNKLLNAVLALSANGGTDYNFGLFNPIAGSLVISKNGKNKKVIVFLTDGQFEGTDVNSIINEANKQNCVIYSVVLEMNCPQSLKDISVQTGGQWFENVRTEEQAKSIYEQIQHLVQNSEPCTIEWQSDAVCKNNLIKVDAKIISNNLLTSLNYQAARNSIANLEITPSGVYFKNIQPGTTKDTTITVKAVNSDFNVTNVISSNTAFTLDKTSFYLANGQSIDLKVTFSPSDSAYTYSKFTFENSTCSASLFAVGGFAGIKPNVQTLKLTEPNGGEEFIVGTDTLITWEGIPETDTVSLEYSFDNGKSWNLITNYATGLKYVWKNVPKPASEQCLVRVKQYELDNNGKVQAPQVEWAKTYGGSFIDFAREITLTDDGGFIIIGETASNDGDVKSKCKWFDYWVVKLNISGEIVWEKTYGGIRGEAGYTIDKTLDGGYILGGVSVIYDSIITGNYGLLDVWIVKINSKGDIEWENNFGSPDYDYCYNLHQTRDLGYIMAGFRSLDDMGNDSTDAWIMKLNNSGDIEWQKIFNGSKNDYAPSIQETNDGGFIYMVNSSSEDGDFIGNYGGSDIWVVKSNAKGEIIWKKNYGGSNFDWGNSILQTKDGGYIISGRTCSNDIDVTENNGEDNAWIFKLDSIGNIEWKKNYGGSKSDYFKSIYPTNDKGYIIVGGSNSNDGDLSNNNGDRDYWIVKIEQTGTIKWQKNFGGSADDLAWDVLQTNDGGYIISGKTESNDGDVINFKGEQDFWIIKLSPEGNVLQQDVSDTLFSIVMPKPLVNDIDMKKCLVGSTKDSLISTFISNDGSYKFSVDSIYFTGADANCFKMVSGLPKYEVAANTEHFAEINFTPNRTGVHNAQIHIKTQSETIIKNIIGEGVVNQVEIHSKVIDFGTVELGNYKDTIKCLTIKNVGTEPLNIINTKHNKPNDVDFSTLSGGGSFTVQPGETREMNLRFTANSVGRTCGALEFHYNGVGSPAVVQLYGQVKHCNGLITSYSQKDEQLFMDSVLYGNMNCKILTIKNNTEDDFVLDSAYLLKNVDFSVPQSQLPLYIKASDSINLKICYSPVELGKSVDTLIYNDLCNTKKIPVLGYCLPNQYEAESNCSTGIEMKTQKGNNVKLYLPSPNPFNESTTLKYYSSNPVTATVEIFNLYGEKIISFNKESIIGMNELTIRANELPNGTYFCIFKIEDLLQTFKVTLMR